MERFILGNYPLLLIRLNEDRLFLKKKSELEERTLKSFYNCHNNFKKLCLRSKGEEILLNLEGVLKISPFLSKLFDELRGCCYTPHDQVDLILDDFYPHLLDLLQQLLEIGECVVNSEIEGKELTDLIDALGLSHLPFFNAPVSNSAVNQNYGVTNQNRLRTRSALNEREEVEKGGRKVKEKHKLDQMGQNDFNEEQEYIEDEEYEPAKKIMKKDKRKKGKPPTNQQSKQPTTPSYSSSPKTPNQNLNPTERLALNIGDMSYAMYNNRQREFKKCKITGKNADASTFKIQFEGNRTKNKTTGSILVSGKHLALFEPPKHELAVGTRCVALFTEEDDAEDRFFPAVVAESPTAENDSRYLIFFDDGYMDYFSLKDLREMVNSVTDVKDGPCDPEFIQNYLEKFPDYPVLSLAVGDKVEKYIIEKEVWVEARVVDIDASLVHIDPGEDYDQGWMYKGSPLLRSIGDKSQAVFRFSVKKKLCLNGCGEEFISEEMFKSHNKNCAFKVEEKVPCQLCEDTDYKERNLSEHLYRRHEDLKRQVMKSVTDKFSPNTSFYTFEKNKTIWTCSLCSKKMKGKRSGVGFHWAVEHKQIMMLYEPALKEKNKITMLYELGLKEKKKTRQKSKLANSNGQTAEAYNTENSSNELEVISLKVELVSDLDEPENELANPLESENEECHNPVDNNDETMEIEFEDNLTNVI